MNHCQKKAAHQMPKDRLTPYDYGLYMKILAELIVRECARVADTVEAWDIATSGVIEKHFGVKIKETNDVKR